MKPLNYAILNLFSDGREACPEEVIEARKGEYGHFKALNKADVLTSLMTAESNGLLEQSRFELDEQGEVRMYFRANAESIATINKYIR